ncbi:MAG: ROK family protein [Verrucomicrobiota bacterium]
MGEELAKPSKAAQTLEMDLPHLFGVDIGGTKTAVIRGNKSGVPEEVVAFETGDADTTLKRVFRELDLMVPDHDALIGVACGDPLDRLKGIIQEPPNLPGWKDIRIVERLEDHFTCKAYLMNDANAGALAEWRFGAGEKSRNMMFVTAGTGFGAGMILNGQLYEGISGSAGEIGHVRLSDQGPTGYGKVGSVEGFCSGGGIAQVAQAVAISKDGEVAFNPGDIGDITAKSLAAAAKKGDRKALEIFEDVGQRYGQALAILIDILNPERIVIGSVFERCRPFLEPSMRRVLKSECLDRSLGVCEIVPAALGDEIGNYAALAVAQYRAGFWKCED